MSDVVAERRTVHIGLFTTAGEFRDYFKNNYGPTIAVYRNIAGEPDRVATLDNELAALARRFDVGDGAMKWEYLLFTAQKNS